MFCSICDMLYQTKTVGMAYHKARTKIGKLTVKITRYDRTGNADPGAIVSPKPSIQFTMPRRMGQATTMRSS